MAEIISFPDAQAQFERDKKVVNLLVAGKQPYEVAEEMGLSKTEVHEAHHRMMGAVPDDYRARALDLSLRTYDQLKDVWWAIAVNPDTSLSERVEATKAIMRIEDARADRVGIRQLPVRDDTLDDLKQGETSTENLRRVFLEMRAKHPPTIEAEATPVDEKPPEEPSQDPPE